MFLLGGISALDDLQFNKEDLRYLSEQLLNNSKGFNIPYIVVLKNYLAKIIPNISSSLELLFEQFSKKSFSTKSADVVPICPRNNIISNPIIYISETNTNILVLLRDSIENNSLNKNLSVFSRESLVDTTLSILKMLLLCLIIIDLNGDHVTTHCIHHTEFFF